MAQDAQDEGSWASLSMGGVLARVQGLDSDGKGYALVNVACDRGKTVVVKRYFVDDASEEAIKLATHEIVMMRQLKHGNILPCLGSSLSSMEIWLVTPLQELGSLRRILDQSFPEGIPEASISPIVSDVLRGLQHLHERGIVHRALQAAHILLDAQGRAKLSGLRYSCSLYDTGTDSYNIPSVGCIPQDRYDFPLFNQKHLNWMSPEMLQQNLLGYCEKTDIYSLGVTLCELANGLIPFSDMPNTFMLLEKLKGQSPKLFDSSTIDSYQASAVMVFSGQKPADSGVGASVGSSTNIMKPSSNYAKRSFSLNFHDFVNSCCELLPEDRPTAGQLLSHPFIKHHKKSSSSSLSLASLISSCRLIRADSTNEEEEDALNMAMSSKMCIDYVEWDF